MIRSAWWGLGVGVLMGAVSAWTALAHSWLSLVPWTILGLIIGWFATDWQTARRSGGLYGLGLFVSFLILGFHGNGSSSQLVGFLTLTVVLGLIGTLYGLALGLAGQWIRQRNAAR